ncbi:interferon epsilon [Ictidomys tridecemlineatus]|uniref:Interferon epsilon n=1 Tax=Ictidomys tridecemlineatus TaxID=43179 RepID=I3N5Z0_ICTTR|nr:interferon epsilon [Ictidomys tridecemlineatus]KAG3287331.1 interferon epsilon [Ictidomys tridecemlineatus]
MIHKQFPGLVLVLLVFFVELKLVLLQQRIKEENLQLLNNLQTSSIQQCLPYRKNFRLPQNSVNFHQYPKGHVLAILHEMLQQIFNLFKKNISLGSREENHIPIFLTDLHQQLEYLETLLGLEAEQKSHAQGSKNLRLQVKAYFRRIHNYLESQRHSSCAWTIVHAEINRCLVFVFRLIRQEIDP